MASATTIDRIIAAAGDDDIIAAAAVDAVGLDRADNLDALNAKEADTVKRDG